MAKRGAKSTDPLLERAYRGYLIRLNRISDKFQIMKGGFYIGSENTMEEAKKTVDLLTD